MSDLLNWFDEIAEGPEYDAECAKIEFAVCLERRMKRCEINKTELANKLGCTQAYTTKVLRGDSNLTIESMARLAYATGGTLHIHIAPKKVDVRWMEVYRRDGHKTPPKAAFVWSKNERKRAYG